MNQRLANVNSIKAELSRLDRDIKKREKFIVDNQAGLKKIAADMAKVLAQMAAKEARSTDVQKLLEPYELAKTALTTKKSATDAAFTWAQTAFAANL